MKKCAVALFALLGWMIPVPLSDGVFFAAPPAQEREDADASARVLFVGDMLFDRSILQYADEHGDDHPLSCVASEFAAYDLVVANLEGPITPESSVSTGSAVGSSENYRFTMPMRTAEILARHNIRAVSIANNHINDFGPEGVAATRRALASADVAYAGDPHDPDTISATIDAGNMQFELVAYNAFYGATFSETVEHMEQIAAEVPFIVFAHWGEEYAPVSAQQRRQARRFVEAGADLVVGAHPHVIQESEMIEGVPVYYSIGNFLFDQYWDPSVTDGLALEVTVSRTGIEDVTQRRVRHGTDRRTCFE